MKKRIVSLVLAAILLAGNTMLPVRAATIDSAQQKAKELEKKKKAAEQEQQSLSSQLNTIISELQQAQADVDAKEIELGAAEDELVAAKIKENEQYESMKIRIKYMYENGDVELFEILFTAKDMSDFLNKAEYVQQVSEYDRNMLKEFQKLVKEVEEKEAAIQAEKEELLKLQDTLSAKHSEVETLLASKKNEVADLESEIGENAKVLNNLIAQAKEAERRKQEAANASKPSSGGSSSSSGGGSSKPGNSVIVNGNGYLSNPCPSARISSEFGPRKAPVPGASTYHEGRDYAAPSGTPIYAAAEGTVIQKGYHSVRGNYVVVRHPNGLTTWYQHCTTIFVSTGQKVSRGQNIATVGATGRVSGPHLHFIVQESSGKLVDPRKYL